MLTNARHAGQNPQTFCEEYCISREIVLSDDEIYELVMQCKDTTYDSLPEEYAGLTTADLFNILLCFRGREREK